MCLIIDANIASLVFTSSQQTDFSPAFSWLNSPRANGSMVYGGRLAAELFKNASVRRYVRALYQSGRAFKFSDESVVAETARLMQAGACRSDDEHVIAIARISGARTLCSHDHDLHADFRDPQLVNNPRGSIYQTPQHTHLLRHTPSCPFH